MFRIDSLQRSRITYGCIVALGAVATAGITEIEIHGKQITNWFERVALSVQENMESGGGSGGQPVTTDQVLSPFTFVGSEIGKAAVSVWPYVQTAFGAVATLKDNWEIAFKTIKDFLRSLFDSQIFNRIFENFHIKIWNLITFAVAGGDGRDTFISLFRSDRQADTFLTAKLLLGQTVPEIKNFRVQPNVFHYLFLRWMDKPKEVTKKFDRLTQYVKKLVDKLKSSNGGSSSGGGSADESKTYWLKIPTLKEYLDVKEGIQENIFNTVWTGEVLLKMTAGTDDFVGAKTIATMLGGFLSPFSNSWL